MLWPVVPRTFGVRKKVIKMSKVDRSGHVNCGYQYDCCVFVGWLVNNYVVMVLNILDTIKNSSITKAETYFL